MKGKGDKLYVKWKGYNNSFNSWIDKNDVVRMCEYFPKPKSLGTIESDLSNYPIKSDL